jgi:hypothetical protein
MDRIDQHELELIRAGAIGRAPDHKTQNTLVGGRRCDGPATLPD